MRRARDRVGLAMKRRSISKAMRARILQKTKGRCYHETCRVELHNGWIVEHVHPLALGGPDTEDNMMPSCVPCARRKTFGLRQTTYGSDVHAIAKTRRIKKKREASNLDVLPDSFGMSPYKRPIPSRGFTRWRKFNGEIVER